MIEHYIKIVKGINYFPKCSIKDVCQGAIMPLLTKRWISTAEGRPSKNCRSMWGMFSELSIKQSCI